MRDFNHLGRRGFAAEGSARLRVCPKRRPFCDDQTNGGEVTGTSLLPVFFPPLNRREYRPNSAGGTIGTFFTGTMEIETAFLLLLCAFRSTWTWFWRVAAIRKQVTLATKDLAPL